MSAAYRTFELRDDPDDLPIGPFTTLAAARNRAHRRADRTGDPVLIYEIDAGGERLVTAINP